MFHFALPDGSGFDLAYPGSGPIAAFDAAGNIVAICIGVEKRLCKFLREVKKAQDVNKFKDEAQEWVERIEAKNKPWSVHEFLVDLPFEPPRASLNYRVTYQDSCHLSNTQGVTQQPRQLLQSIPGVEFVELSNASMCCGAGGTYTITERESSLRVLDAKMTAVKDTGADIIATANPGCVLQIQYGAQNMGLPIKVRYVTDLLDEAYRLEAKM